MKCIKLFTILTVMLTALMITSCTKSGDENTPGNTAQTDISQTPVTSEPDAGNLQEKSEEEKTSQASIDFEDSIYGFALISTSPRKADESELSIKEINGSKVLYAKNMGQPEMYIGFDADALLKDNTKKLSAVRFTMGLDFEGAEFKAVGGYVHSYAGRDRIAVKSSNSWVIYMENKNPREFTINLKGANFVNGADNYILFSAGDLDGSEICNIYIDNIAFLDADGNVLTADNSAVFEAPEGFFAKKEEESDEDNTDKLVIAIDEKYGGDWGQSGIIPAEVINLYPNGCTITYKFDLEPNYAYYLYAPIYANWGKLIDATGITVKNKTYGEPYHLQNDGFVAIDDLKNKQITLKLSAETMAKLIEDGAGLSCQTYGVTAYEAVISE